MSANGLGLFDMITGSPTIDSTTKRTGSYSLRAYAASSAQTMIEKASTGTMHVGVFYFRWHTAPAAACPIFIAFIVAGSDFEIWFDPADSKIYPYCNGAGTKSATALTVDTWYRIDYKCDMTTGTSKLDIQLDGTAIAQKTCVQTASTFQVDALGICSATTADFYFDDWMMSSTSGDYPIGAIAIVGLSPTSDGTHTNTANTVEFQDGTDIVAATTTAYTAVNSVPIGDNTTYIRQVATGAYYAELKFTTAKTNIKGAIALLSYRSSSTTSDNGACYWIDEDAVTTTIWGNPTTRADYSETSAFYKSVVLPVTAGGWDAAAIIAGKIRCGNSSDINPNPYWLDLMIEVAYVPTSGYSLLCATGTFAESGSNAFMLLARKLFAAAGSFALAGAGAKLIKSYPLKAATGTFAETGNNAIMKWTHQIRAATGTFSETGNNALLLIKRLLKTATGTFNETGNNAILRVGKKLFSATGVFNETGNNALLLRRLLTKTTTGSFSLASTGAILTYAAVKNLTNAGGIAGAEAFGVPTVSVVTPPVNLTNAGGIVSAAAYGTPATSARVAATGLASVAAYGSPALRVTVSTTGITSAAAYGTPSTKAGLTITAGIVSASAYGVPTVTPTTLLTNAGGLASAAAYGTPSAKVRVAPTSITSSEAIGTPATKARVASVSISSAEAFGVPVINTTTILRPVGIASVSAYGVPTTKPNVSVSSIPSSEALGTVTLTPRITGAGGIVSAEAIGIPLLAKRLVAVGIPSAEAIGISTLILIFLKSVTTSTNLVNTLMASEQVASISSLTVRAALAEGSDESESTVEPSEAASEVTSYDN